MFNLIKSLTAFAGVFMLAACSGGSGGPLNLSGGNSGASPSLGLVQNATVNFYQGDGTTLVGTGDTGTDGQVQISAAGYSGPVVVEVLGDDVDAMYFDEYTGSLVAFPAGNTLHALVPNARSTVGVTPLTEIAYRAALAQSLLPITSGAVNQLNEIVRTALAPGLTSLLSVPTRFDANTTSGSLADDEGGRYALVLAALAELNNGNASPALATLNALVADLSDGVIDGQNNGSPVADAAWGANFISAMSAALNSVASNFGNASLQSNAASQAPSSTTVDASGVSNGGGGGNTGGGDFNGETVAGTVNSALVGTFDLVYVENTPGAPFTDGQMVQVVVGSDNSLRLPSGRTLTNPFYRVFGTPNEAEVIWLDSVDNIEYGLSDNSGGNFNEINLGDASNPQSTNGIPGFLGQLRMAEDGMAGCPPPELAAIAGQYMGQIVSKSGSFSMGRSLEDRVLVNIDSDSVVTVDSQFVFDPTATGYDFRDNRSNPNESFYRVQIPDGDNSMSFDVIFEDADSTTPIAYRLRSIEALGGGSSRISTLELEERPLPTEVTAFFSAMIADSPVALTAVSVDAGFNSPFAVCDELSLISDNGSTVNSSNSRTPFRYLLNSDMGSFRDSEIYRRSYTRYSDTSGDQSLLFLRNRIVRRGDGFIDFIGTDAQNADRSRATNDPAAIMAAGCGGMMSADPQVGNMGMSRVVGNGFTGVVDGTEYTFNGDVRLAPNNSGDGFSRLDGVGPGGIQRWRLFVPETPGTYSCDDAGNGTVLQTIQTGDNSGAGSGNGSCTVKVIQGGPIYEGYFTGVFQRRVNQPLADVSDGYYYFDPTPSGTGGGSLPAGTNAALINVTEAAGSFQQGDSFLPPNTGSGNTRPGQIFGNFSGDGIDFFQVIGLPETTGSFACGSVPPGQFQQVGMSFNFNYSSSNTGSSCTINITSNSGNIYEGNYTAVLFQQNNTDSISIEGEFRFPLP